MFDLTFRLLAFVMLSYTIHALTGTLGVLDLVCLVILLIRGFHHKIVKLMK